MSNPFLEALQQGEKVLAAKEDFKFQFKEYNRKLGAYESDVQDFKLSGKATAAGYEDLERRRTEILEEKELLQEAKAELNSMIDRYQEMRAEVDA